MVVSFIELIILFLNALRKYELTGLVAKYRGLLRLGYPKSPLNVKENFFKCVRVLFTDSISCGVNEFLPMYTNVRWRFSIGMGAYGLTIKLSKSRIGAGIPMKYVIMLNNTLRCIKQFR